MQKKKIHVLKGIRDPRQKLTGTFITQAISQKDDTLCLSDVSLPSDENVDEARDWVNFNKK